MKWISVYERLPDNDTPVWIYWKNREVLIGQYTYTGREKLECDPTEGWFSFEDNKYRYNSWWMPIGPKPEPPNIELPGASNEVD